MSSRTPKASKSQRIKLACLRCRNKKMKCDGNEPCSNCAYSNDDCLFEERRRPMLSEKVLMEKLAALQSRYDALVPATSTSGNPDKAPPAAISFVGFPPSGQVFGSSLSAAPLKIPRIEAVVTRDIREFLIRVAMIHLPRCNFDIDPTGIWEALKLPPEQQPHPALLNVVMLFGTFYITATPGESLPPGCPSPDYFVQETRTQMVIALSDVDRLMDYVTAGTMLAWWFVQNGRWLEGHVEICTTARLGIDCGLHQIDEQTVKSVLYPGLVAAPLRQVEGILGPPTSILDLETRIAVFWGVYLVDRVAALVTGLPAAFDERTSNPELAITTVFQRRPGHYADPWGPNDFCSIDDLMGFSQVPSTTPRIFKPVPTPQTVFCAYAQGITLLLRGIRLSSGTPQTLQEALDTRGALATLNEAMERFTRQLPREVTMQDIERSPPPYAFGATYGYSAFFCLAEVRCAMFVIIIRMHQAAEQLQKYVEGEDGVEAIMSAGETRKMEAAHKATATVELTFAEFSKPDCDLGTKDGICVTTGFMWATLSGIYIERIAKLRKAVPTEATKAELELCSNNLLKLVAALKRLAQVFPILHLQVQKVYLVAKDTIGIP